MKRAPVVLLLHASMVQQEDGLRQWFQAEPGKTRHQIRYLYSLFAFKSDEYFFARELVVHKPNFWVFRCNQKAFCGDFLVVDMSAPKAADRSLWLLDLKEGCPLHDGAGPAGAQMIRAARAVAAVHERYDAVLAEQVPTKLVGAALALLTYFGCGDSVAAVSDHGDEGEVAEPGALSLS